jgi:hypothetical protein
MDLLLTLLVLVMGLGVGIYAGWTFWGDDYKHCRHRFVEGVYGDERNRTYPFVLRCTICARLIEGEIDEANWPLKQRSTEK